MSEVMVIFLQLILFVNTAAFFYSLLGLVSYLFWEGDSGEEISARWCCLKEINHSRDSWLVLRGLQAGFSYLQRHHGYFRDTFFFSWETVYSAVLSLTDMLRLYQIMPMFWSRWLLFWCDKPCTCSYTRTQRFLLLRSCAYLNLSVNLAFGPKSGFKNKCRARAGFGLVISGSGRVQASKWGPFTTLCRYVCRGQKGEIESIHPPPTNSKFRSKSFCEVGYANFRPSVFAPGKRISMEILVGVRLHARCPVARKSFVTFSKNGNVQEKYLSSL